MNHGVEILIARMKSNPEDFEYNGKFSTYGSALAELAGGSERVRRVEDPVTPFYFLTEEDRAALVEAWNERMCEGFTRGVMKTLMEEPKSIDEERIYPSTDPRSVYNTASTAISTSTMNAMAQQRAHNLQREEYLRMQAMNNAYQNRLQGGLSPDPRKLFK